MSITFDNERSLAYIYRNLNGAWDTTNYATVDGADLFPDDAQVGDFIIFGTRNPDWPYHDLKINVGTPLAATNISIVWEYQKNSATVWTPITGVTDGTNGFRNPGENTVSFPMLEWMGYARSRWSWRFNISGWKYGNWIRARIASLDGLTEGGANAAGTRPSVRDLTITAYNEPTLNLAALQAASDAGGWEVRPGVKAVETIGDSTLIRASLYMKGTTGFHENQKTIQIGEDPYRVGWRQYGSGIFQLGERDASGKGTKGCYLNIVSKFDVSYDYTYNVQLYGTVVNRTNTQYGAFSQQGVFKMVDSSFISPGRIYLSAGVKPGSEWTRSVYADNDLFYLYSPNLAIDGFKTLDAWQGMLCGGSAVISNSDINGKKLMRYYSADITLIDCENVDRSKITSTAPRGAERHVWEKYHLDVLVLDAGANPLQGATVTLRDVDGTLVFQATTAADGTIPQELVTVYDKWWVSAEGWAMHEKDYNDFTLTVDKYGYGSHAEVLRLLAKTEKTIILQEPIVVTDQETM